MKSVFEIDGMSCNHCVTAVKKELESVDGIRIVKIGIGEAVLDAEMTDGLREQIVEAVTRAGYVVRSMR